MDSPMAATRQAQLQLIKLRALVSDHLGGLEDAAPVPATSFGLGAGLVDRGEAWVLAAERTERSLGPALGWARQVGFPTELTHLHLLAEDATGLLARRAAQFEVPITVWQVDGRAMREAQAAPITRPAAVPAAHEQLRALIVAGGAIPVVEHGVLLGEVHGLEVCRVVDGPDGTPRLEVGVGAHDREAFGLVHGDLPTIDALADVVAAVAAHRSPGAEPHPLNRLGAERALRAALIADPARVGATTLGPAEPPVPRANVKDAVPCVATGQGPNGPMLVVCSVGVDLDVVPFAIDAWLTDGDTSAEIVIALPARDQLPVTDALASWGRPPIRIAPQ
jgi:hypothetical protein